MKNNSSMKTVKVKSTPKSGDRSGKNRANKKSFDVLGGAKAFAKTQKGRVKVTGTKRY